MSSALVATELAIHTRLRAYGAVDIFVCPSRFMHDTMQRGGVFPDRLRHLPHFGTVPEAAPSNDTDPVVLFAGRLSPRRPPTCWCRLLPTSHPGCESKSPVPASCVLRWSD